MTSPDRTTEESARAAPRDERYVRAWNQRARRWLVPLGVLACGAVAVTALHGRVIAILAWLVLTEAAVIWARAWRCPRCGRFFDLDLLQRSPFTRRCIHCGLPRGSTSASAEWAGADPARGRPFFRAAVRVLTAVEGGAAGPIPGALHAEVAYDDRVSRAELEFRGRSEVRAGETATAQVSIADPDAHAATLTPGTRFEVRDGGRTIARGVVTLGLVRP